MNQKKKSAKGVFPAWRNRKADEAHKKTQDKLRLSASLKYIFSGIEIEFISRISENERECRKKSVHLRKSKPF